MVKGASQQLCVYQSWWTQTLLRSRFLLGPRCRHKGAGNNPLLGVQVRNRKRSELEENPVFEKIQKVQLLMSPGSTAECPKSRTQTAFPEAVCPATSAMATIPHPNPTKPNEPATRSRWQPLWAAGWWPDCWQVPEQAGSLHHLRGRSGNQSNHKGPPSRTLTDVPSAGLGSFVCWSPVSVCSCIASVMVKPCRSVSISLPGGYAFTFVRLQVEFYWIVAFSCLSVPSASGNSRVCEERRSMLRDCLLIPISDCWSWCLNINAFLNVGFSAPQLYASQSGPSSSSRMWRSSHQRGWMEDGQDLL